jgi:hypothetical protein
MRLGAIGAVTCVVCALWIASCGLESGGSGSPDASLADASPEVGPDGTGGDAPADVPTGDGNCSLASCNGVETCAGCSAGEALCPETRACGCVGCTARSVECFSCGGGGRIGFCVPNPESCNPGDPCPCNDNVNNCPGGGNQVCTSSGSGGRCLPCGANGTDDKPCKDGRQCESDGNPSCR